MEKSKNARKAYDLLESATVYTKNKNYNIGFTSDWVFRNSTGVPGYYWRYLVRSGKNYMLAADAFRELSKCGKAYGKKQAAYMADLCKISALHIEAVYHLQNAKLPLVGYKAWPMGYEHASWPPPDMLEVLVAEAKKAVELEKEYMRIYSKWVKTSDEQGQLAMHQQGVIEPFYEFYRYLKQRLIKERAHIMD